MRAYSPAEVKRVREATGLSQAKFAERFRMNVRTLQRWEIEGATGPAAILLWLIGKIPQQAARALKDF